MVIKNKIGNVPRGLKEKKKKKNSKLEVDLCSKIEKNIREISEGLIKKSGKWELEIISQKFK